MPLPLVPQTEFVFDSLNQIEDRSFPSLGQIVYLCGLAQPGEAPLKDVVPPPPLSSPQSFH